MRGPAIVLTAAIGGALLVPAAPLAGEPPAPPTAALEAASTSVQAGKTITLDSSKSRAGTGAIVGHVWDLDGNGSFETDTGAKPTVHATPKDPGPLTVRVRVIDDRGLNADAKLDLTVSAPPRMDPGKGASDSSAGNATAAPAGQQGQAPAPGGPPAGPGPATAAGSSAATAPSVEAAPPAPVQGPPRPLTEPKSPPAGAPNQSQPQPQPEPAAATAPLPPPVAMSAAPALLPPQALAAGGTTTATAKAGSGALVTVAAVSTGVTIKNFQFGPASSSVHVGDTITWSNQDIAPHTATASDGSFDTGTINPGKSGSHTFTKAGTFAYICSIHPSMKGTVTVAAASGGTSGSGSGGSGGTSGTGGSTGTTPSTTSAGGLPQTGLDIAAVVLLAALMMGSGTVLRRRVG